MLWQVFFLALVNFIAVNSDISNLVQSFEKELGRNRRSTDESEYSNIKKRDVTCNDLSDINATLFPATNKHVFKDDPNPAISLTWSGQNGVILALTTMSYGFSTSPSRLYRSTNRGKVFKDVSSKLDGGVIRKTNGVHVSPVDNTKVIFIGLDTIFSKLRKTTIHITTDAGESFSKILLPFLIDASSFMFNPLEGNSLLVKSVSNELWVSTDFGQVWRKESDNVYTAKWDPKLSHTFYYVIDPLGKMSRTSVDNELYKRSFQQAKRTLLAQHVHSFAIQGQFIFLSVQFNGNNGSRVMHVSKDHGSTWSAAQLPLINPKQFYSILDMSEDMVFVHVDHPGDTGHGVIYTSDERGIVFSKSLSRHLFPNTQGITDFYKVLSMPGVYITSQLDTSNTVHSRITFNKGGNWEALSPPDGSSCPSTETECKLQIHNYFSASKHVKLPALPLSSKNARGIVLAHGNLGDALNFNPPSVYVTSDGGYTWKKSDLLNGPHFYGIGDSGGILFAVPSQSNLVNTIFFSLDEGDCWHAYNFTTEPFQITGISAEPGERATDVSIWGWDRTGDGSWMAITVDFKAVMGRKCQKSDYEVWLAHETNTLTDEGCMLGQKHKYIRRKKGTTCVNDAAFFSQTGSVEPCTCQKTDYLCDFAYTRDAQGNCVRDTSSTGSHMDICIDNEEEEIETKGYRKIPGDGCTSGFTPERKSEVVSKSCAKVDRSKEEFGLDKNDFETYTVSPPKNPHTGFIIFLVLVVLALGGVLCYVIYAKRKSHLKVRYTPLNQEEAPAANGNALVGTSALVEDDDDAVIVHPDRDFRPKNGATISYHDDSDEDLLVT